MICDIKRQGDLSHMDMSHIEVNGNVIKSHSHHTIVNNDSDDENTMTYEAHEVTSERSSVVHLVSKGFADPARVKVTDEIIKEFQRKSDGTLLETGTTTLKSSGDRLIILFDLVTKFSSEIMHHEFDMKFIKGNFEALKRNEKVMMVYAEGQQKKQESMIFDILHRIFKSLTPDADWIVTNYGSCVFEADSTELNCFSSGLEIVLTRPI